MISPPDRHQAVELIEATQRSGARLRPAGEQLGLRVRTYRRWTQGGEIKADGRPEAVRPVPAHQLSAEERARVLAIGHQPGYASLPPGQIVPALADQGEYLAAESSFYRIRRQAGEQHHRGRSQPPRPPAPPCLWTPAGVALGYLRARGAGQGDVLLSVSGHGPLQP